MGFTSFPIATADSTLTGAQGVAALQNSAATKQTLADAITLAQSGLMIVGGAVNTIEYNAGTGIGGNSYTLVDAGSSGARPAADGGSVIHTTGGSGGLYLKGLFIHNIWIEQFGVNTSGDNALKIKAALDYAETSNSGDVYGRGNVYQISNLTLTKNVALVGPDYNALNVQDMAVTPANETGAIVLQAVSGSTGLLIQADDTSKVSGIKNAIIDATNHTGDVVVFGSSVLEVRNNNYLNNVLIWKGTGKQLHLTALNNGPLIENVFCRGGSDRASAVSNYGIHDESEDSKFTTVFAGFHKLRGLLDDAGSGRRFMVDTWGCQQIGVEISGATSYGRLQSDGNGLNAVKLSSAKNLTIQHLKTIDNNKNAASVNGDVEVFGSCIGTTIVRAELRGSLSGTIDNGFYQDAAATTGITVCSADISSGYTNQINETVEEYWDLNQIRSTSYKHPSMNTNQINTNIAFSVYAANAPLGWVVRNAGSSALGTADLPTDYTSAAVITSSASGTSGIMYTGKTVAEVAGSRIRVKCLAKGSGLTFSGNQFLQIFDGVTDPKVTIPNTATWGEVALVHNIPLAASNFQVRLVAANDTTVGLLLLATGVTIELY